MSKIINMITIPIHEIKNHIYSHQIENGIQWKSLYFPYLLKIQKK
jgi:hypothetical protein